MSVASTGAGLNSEYSAAHPRSEPLPLGTAFLFLVGFIATQGYTIPVVSLPLNWALWPSLPDLFGLGLLFSVVLSRPVARMDEFDSYTSKRLWILVLYSVLSFVALTLPQSRTGVGAKYGGFTLILYFKYVLVSWAASYVPLDEERTRWVHRSALLAFIWLAVTVLASRLGVLDMAVFTTWLPSGSSGRWAAGIDSTVGLQNQTPSAILLLAGLVVATMDYRRRWLTVALLLALGALVTFLTGSRQGVVRLVAFIMVLSARRAGRVLLGLVFIAVLALLLVDAWGGLSVTPGSNLERVLQKQSRLVKDPLTNEALSGRPGIWARTIRILSDNPSFCVVGAGIGSYAEYGGGAHNLILTLLLEGGVLALLLYVVCYGGIFLRLWRIRDRAWPLVAVTAGMLTSIMTSETFYPNLATGWGLGLYLVLLRIVPSVPVSCEPYTESLS